MKALKIAANKADCRFAIVALDNGFAVYRECLNYASHVRGGIAKTWRYVEKGLTIDDAEILFSRKIAGKQKP
jgi:hypothetical protein